MGAGERSAERFVRFVSSYSCTCVYVLVRSNIYKNIDSNLNVETSPHTPVRAPTVSDGADPTVGTDESRDSNRTDCESTLSRPAIASSYWITRIGTQHKYYY